MIAIVYPQFYGVGGIARYLDSCLQNLPDGHPPVVLITGDEGISDRHYEGVRIIHVPFTSNRFSLAIWSWRVRGLLSKLFAEKQIRVVNLHCPPLIPGLFMPRHIPVVWTAHSTYKGMSGAAAAYMPSGSGGLKSRMAVAIKIGMERRILSRARAVITLTEQGRQELRSYGYTGPITEIPNGVDISRFVPERTDRAKDIDVLFVGRINIGKGSRPMVELCKRLVIRNPTLRICIVGYGDDDDYVRQALQGLTDNVQLAGKVPFEQVKAFYSRSKVYVSTSYYEGLPGTCLEALAMEVPAVVWDFLFYRGLVNPGETGFLVPVNDLDAMAERVEYLCANPDEALRLGQQGRRLLSERYDWSGLSGKVVDWLVEQEAR